MRLTGGVGLRGRFHYHRVLVRNEEERRRDISETIRLLDKGRRRDIPATTPCSFQNRSRNERRTGIGLRVLPIYILAFCLSRGDAHNPAVFHHQISEFRDCLIACRTGRRSEPITAGTREGRKNDGKRARKCTDCACRFWAL